MAFVNMDGLEVTPVSRSALDQPLEPPSAKESPGEEVEPHRLSAIVQALERIRGCLRLALCCHAHVFPFGSRSDLRRRNHVRRRESELREQILERRRGAE